MERFWSNWPIEKFWKWGFFLAIAALVGQLFVWPYVTAGRNAVQYINLCIQAQVCPSPDTLQTIINQRAAATAPVTAPKAPPQSPPAVEDKKPGG